MSEGPDDWSRVEPEVIDTDTNDEGSTDNDDDVARDDSEWVDDDDVPTESLDLEQDVGKDTDSGDNSDADEGPTDHLTERDFDDHLIGTRVQLLDSYGVVVVASMYDEDDERVDITCRHTEAGEMRVHSVERTQSDPIKWKPVAGDDAPAVVADAAEVIQMLDRAFRGDGKQPPGLPDKDVDIELDLSDDDDDVTGVAARYSKLEDDIDWDAVTSPTVNEDEAIEDIARQLVRIANWMSVSERNSKSHVDLWYWDPDDGWIEDADTQVLKPFLTAYTPFYIDSNFVRKVAYQVSGLTTVRDDDLNAGPDNDGLYVPVANGVLDLTDVDYDSETMSIDTSTVDLIDHKPEHRWTYRVDTAWDPESADVDAVDEWLNELFDRDDDIRVFLEFVGHALVPEYPAHGFGVLLGEGQGGKSKLLRSVRETIGNDNVASQDLKSIEEDRFGMQPVYGKLLNIDDDVSGTKLASTSTLKKFSAGGRVTIDVKMKPLIETYNQATLLLASQNPLALPQRDKAIGRRLYPLEVVAQYVNNPSGPHEYEREPEQKVIERVTSEAYRRAMLVRGVEGLVRLHSEGDFSSDSSWDERIQRYETWADPIADFARVVLEQVEGSTFMENDNVEDVAVSSKDLKRAYDVYAQRNNHPGKSIQQLSKVLEDLPYLSFSKHRDRSWSSRDGKDTYYRGIRFRRYAKKELLGDWADWERYNVPSDDDNSDEESQVKKDLTQHERKRAVRNVIEEYQMRDDPPGAKIPRVKETLTKRFDVDADTIERDIQKMVREGKLMEVGGVGSERYEFTDTDQETGVNG